MSDKQSVKLAPVTESDYGLLAQWISSNAGLYASGMKNHASAADVKAFLEQADDEYMLVCTPDGEALGSVGWKPADTPGNYVVGAMIGDAGMWGAGFGLEATVQLVGMLFDSKNAHRVEFICGVYNRYSVETFCSGMITIEGLLRDYFFVDGTYHDALIGSILREEYYAVRKPSEVIPAEDKAAAQKLVTNFLDKHPIVPRDSAATVPAATGSPRA